MNWSLIVPNLGAGTASSYSSWGGGGMFLKAQAVRNYYFLFQISKQELMLVFQWWLVVRSIDHETDYFLFQISEQELEQACVPLMACF